MFENLSKRLDTIFQNLRRRGKLTEADVDASLREVRLALLDADVNYTVVKSLTQRIRVRAIGTEVSKALNPAQQIIKIVNEELIQTLGTPEELNFRGEKPYVMMLVGLQGSGKTTAAAKLAKWLRHKGERVLLVAADPYRPAAVEQLQILGKKIDVNVFHQPNVKPDKLAKEAYASAKKGSYSVMIIDTAGRSQLDEPLMQELQAISRQVKPVESLLVVDAMTGQEALNIAQGYNKNINLTGLMMTKIDGDARGGAAISIREITGIPIKFLGTGEGVDAIELFDPERLASRILGMGDILGLIEKAENAFDQVEAEKQADRLAAGEFSLEDFADQLKQMRKMGPLAQIMDMLPGQMGMAAKKVDPQDAENQLKSVEAIINSMTREERRDPRLLNASRRRRIAYGSGKEVQDVNRVLKQFRDAQRMVKQLKKTGGRGNLGRLFG